MGLEGHHRQRRLQFMRQTRSGSNHLLMAAMHPVKIAKRHDCPARFRRHILVMSDQSHCVLRHPRPSQIRCRRIACTIHHTLPSSAVAWRPPRPALSGRTLGHQQLRFAIHHQRLADMGSGLKRDPSPALIDIRRRDPCQNRITDPHWRLEFERLR